MTDGGAVEEKLVFTGGGNLQDDDSPESAQRTTRA